MNSIIIIEKCLKNNLSENEIVRFKEICKKDFRGFLQLFNTQSKYLKVFFADNKILYSHLKFKTGYTSDKSEEDIHLIIKIYRFLEKEWLNNDPETKRYQQETKERTYGSRIVCLEPFFEAGCNTASYEERMDEIRSGWL